LLESIIEPSKVIAEVYRTIRITTKSGAILEGRIVAEDEKMLLLATIPWTPTRRPSAHRARPTSHRRRSPRCRPCLRAC